jgi:hypothetical protein
MPKYEGHVFKHSLLKLTRQYLMQNVKALDLAFLKMILKVNVTTGAVIK